jgi:hypothetical protein
MNKLVFAEYESKAEDKRAHLGASQIGHPCDRYLWLSFRWAFQSNFEGRILKLFKRGHLEETIITNDLTAAGMEVTGQQNKCEFGSHFSGSIDGIVLNVPTAEKTKHLLECKTSSKKYFMQLVKDGVEKSKPVHYIQMQLYMKAQKLERALYVVTCKDDDHMYFERVYYKKEIAEKYIDRGIRIIKSERMPEPMPNASENWYECKYCDAFDFCFKSKQIKPECVNCRTCAHSTPIENHEWKCEIYHCSIETSNQRLGCPAHTIHPDLVPWKLRNEDCTNTEAAYVIEGEIVLNGEHGKNSRYLLSDKITQDLIDMSNGEIVLDVFDGAVRK